MGDYNRTPTLESIVAGLQSDVAALQRGTQQSRAPFARAGLGFTFSVPNNTDTPVDWDSASWHTSSFDYASGTAFTAKIGGRFDVYAYCEFASNATGYRSLRVVRNATDQITGDSSPALNGRTTLLSATASIVLEVNDTIEMYVKQTSGGALDLVENYSGGLGPKTPLGFTLVYQGPA